MRVRVFFSLMVPQEKTNYFVRRFRLFTLSWWERGMKRDPLRTSPNELGLGGPQDQRRGFCEQKCRERVEILSSAP